MSGLTSPDESREVQLFGQNLGDEDYLASSREFVAVTTGVTRDTKPQQRAVNTHITYDLK